ncbi:hypothetical protein IID20_02440 [Patescibacteria group bacterium]|nr:hypothetical protein [Patescibacteria group bacterium]
MQKALLYIIFALSNIGITFLAIYNGYKVFSTLFNNPGPGIIFILYIFVMGSILRGKLVNYLVGGPVALVSGLAILMIPWGFLTGPGFFLAYLGARWANPKVDSNIKTV